MALVESVSNVAVAILDTRTVLLGNLLVGSRDAAGCDWVVEDVPGWAQSASTGQVTGRTYAHGGWADRAFLAPGTFTVRGVCVAPSSDVAVVAWDRLMGVVSVDDVETVVVTEGSVATQCDARQSGEPLREWLSDRAFRFDVMFAAPDPRRLGSVLHSVTVGLPSSTGGLVFPVTFPATIDAVVSGGPVTVVNAGNVTSACVVRLDGPVDTPRLTHGGQQRTLTVQVDVLAGQWVEIDMDRRWARLNGAVARVTSGQWPTVEPGVNVLRFDADTYEAAAEMTVTWRDAFR